MRGTNVNTTPQSTIDGQNERRYGGRSTKAKAGFKGQYDTERKDANAQTVAYRLLHMPTTKKEVRRRFPFMHCLQTPWPSMRIQTAYVVEQQ